MTEEEIDKWYEEQEDENLLKRYHLEKAEEEIPFVSLHYNALYGDDPESAVCKLHQIASHACFLLRIIKEKNPKLIEDLAATCIEWPVSIEAVNMGKKDEVPVEVKEVRKLPIAEKFPLKIKGHGKGRGLKKDDFFYWLVMMVQSFESTRRDYSLIRKEGSRPILEGLLEERDPAGCIRNLAELDDGKVSQKAWANAIAKHFGNIGLPDKIKSFLREDAEQNMTDRKSQLSKKKEKLDNNWYHKGIEPEAGLIEKLNIQIEQLIEPESEDYLKALKEKTLERLKSLIKKKFGK